MIIRLHPNESGHWALFETFQRRCVAYGEQTGWPINNVLLQEIRARFTNAPRASGYFITESGNAHLLSWFVSVWGESGIQVYQASGEPRCLQMVLGEFFETCLPKWIDELESAMRATGQEQRISFLEYATERPAGWERLLRPYRARVIAEKQMTVVRLGPYRGSNHAGQIDQYQ